MHFKSPAGEAAFRAVYDAALQAWPVPYTTQLIPTRLGATHVITCGPADGPPLVLLHALGTSSTVWLPNVAALSRTYRLYLVDIIGDANRSQWTGPIGSRSDCAAWLADVFDGLQLDHAHLGGLSYGGWITLNFALAAPHRVRSAILLAPAASLVKFPLSFFFRLLTPVLWPTRAVVRRTLNWLAAPGRELDPRLAEQMLLGVKHFRFPKGGIYPSLFTDEELQSLHLPTLLLIGEHEVIYKPQAALERARRLIPGIRAELVADAGHVLNMEQAELVNQRLLTFLESVEASSITA